MRKIREILRQKWVLGRSHREVAASLGVSVGAVSAVETRARDGRARLGGGRTRSTTTSSRPGSTARPWSEPPAAAGSGLPPRRAQEAGRDAGAAAPRVPGAAPRRLPLHAVLRALPALVLRTARLSMRQVHRAGEKLFVDYSGKKPHLVDPDDRRGARGRAVRRRARRVELHVRRGDARRSRSADWIASHVRAFEYFGGVTGAVVPDQLKSGVTDACRYEPGIQRTLRGAGAALRHGDPAGAAGHAARQGQGRGRRAGRPALDPRAAAPRDLLLARTS